MYFVFSIEEFCATWEGVNLFHAAMFQPWLLTCMGDVWANCKGNGQAKKEHPYQFLGKSLQFLSLHLRQFIGNLGLL